MTLSLETVCNELAAAFGAEPHPDQTDGVDGYRMERDGTAVILQPFFGGWAIIIRRPGFVEKRLFRETAADLVRELGNLGLLARS